MSKIGPCPCGAKMKYDTDANHGIFGQQPFYECTNQNCPLGTVEVFADSESIEKFNYFSNMAVELAALQKFAGLAKPIVERVGRSWHGDRVQTSILYKECTACLAVYPKKPKTYKFIENTRLNKIEAVEVEQPLSHCHNVPAVVMGYGSRPRCSKCYKPFLTAEEKKKVDDGSL